MNKSALQVQLILKFFRISWVRISWVQENKVAEVRNEVWALVDLKQMNLRKIQCVCMCVCVRTCLCVYTFWHLNLRRVQWCHWDKRKDNKNFKQRWNLPVWSLTFFVFWPTGEHQPCRGRDWDGNENAWNKSWRQKSTRNTSRALPNTKTGRSFVFLYPPILFPLLAELGVRDFRGGCNEHIKARWQIVAQRTHSKWALFFLLKM